MAQSTITTIYTPTDRDANNKAGIIANKYLVDQGKLSIIQYFVYKDKSVSKEPNSVVFYPKNEEARTKQFIRRVKKLLKQSILIIDGAN